jgi:hypothetical protein
VRLRLREPRRGISWSEAFVITVVILALVFLIDLVTDDPAESILNAVLVGLLLLGVRLMANRDP